MITAETKAMSADVQFPGSCIGCGGSLAVRITASGAYGCCLRCHHLATLRLEQEGLELRVLVGGAALA